jgi:hypothetical protein
MVYLVVNDLHLCSLHSMVVSYLLGLPGPVVVCGALEDGGRLVDLFCLDQRHITCLVVNYPGTIHYASSVST